MYKDPDKQREADRERQRRYRANRGLKAYSKGVTNSKRDNKGVTNQGSPIMDELKAERIRMQKCEDKLDLLKALAMKDIGGKPKRGYIGAVHEVPGLTVIKPKRGKDIKTFEDLPPDVQDTIDRMSVVEGRIDQIIKANRTAIAVNYQHQFLDKFYSIGFQGNAHIQTLST